MFNQSLVPGLSHESVIAVTDDLTVPHVSPRLSAFENMPPVFATAFMVAVMEATCVEFLDRYLDEGVRTVGVQLDVRHTAATPVGMSVRTRVELRSIKDRILTFDVRAEDEAGLVGDGTHERALIRSEAFMKRAEAKLQAVMNL